MGGASVDSITISHPNLAELKEEERTEMTQILGEDKIRFLVATVDENGEVRIGHAPVAESAEEKE